MPNFNYTNFVNDYTSYTTVPHTKVHIFVQDDYGTIMVQRVLKSQILETWHQKQNIYQFNRCRLLNTTTFSKSKKFPHICDHLKLLQTLQVNSILYVDIVNFNSSFPHNRNCTVFSTILYISLRYTKNLEYFIKNQL